VCDPVAGLVIVPCIKRNAIGVMNAFLAAEMALSGVTSLIPADEVIEAMRKVGAQLPNNLKETGTGGLADTPTGRRIKAEIFKDGPEM
jgi:L-serine dehydratase